MPGNLLISETRGKKNIVSHERPYHFFHEQELGLDGIMQDVNTIFLTGKECAFKCLMCDLWKNTLDYATPVGAIVQQIEFALARLPKATTIKLYNSSNFFDAKAVPPGDHTAIINLVKDHDRVIVENHPKLCNDNCVEFASKLNGRLEVAMGLESIHPGVVAKLNKQMVPDDFKKAASFLRSNNIDVRAFVLLSPPYLTDKKESIGWAYKTVQFAFESGANRCIIIPVRGGNGIMEMLQKEGAYIPPTLTMLEEVFDKSLALQQGQVFVDTWDIAFTSTCGKCFDARKQRLETMNTTQKIYQPVACSCHTTHA